MEQFRKCDNCAGLRGYNKKFQKYICKKCGNVGTELEQVEIKIQILEEEFGVCGLKNLYAQRDALLAEKNK